METVSLIGLALIDSLSAGTFVIPLGLIVAWRGLKPLPYLVYLLTVAGCYFLLGVLLFYGVDVLSIIASQQWFHWILLILGGLLAAVGILSPSPKKPDNNTKPRPIKVSTGVAGMVTLGLSAALAEAATMVPYLAAIGIIRSLDVSAAGHYAYLAIYCFIMIAPALIVGFLAMTVGKRILPKIEHAIPRLEYEVKITLLWLAAIIGIWLVANQGVALGLWG